MPSEQHIWNPDTGVTDLPENWRDLVLDEMRGVRHAWQKEQERLRRDDLLEKFNTQLSREWAIETGVIENLYEIDRGVTQTMIEQGFQAAFLEHGSTNKPREWVIDMLKTQKEALEGLFIFVKQERDLSASYIKELHSVLLTHQTEVEALTPDGKHTMIPALRGEWKKQPNYPVRNGITYYYCPPEQVESEIDRLIAMHKEHQKQGIPAEVESAWLHHRFSQIHPFQDGNGRVVRTLASLIFIQAGLFPLVVTRDNKVTYLDALESADAGDLKPLVNLFGELQIAQYRKSLEVIEGKVSDVNTALDRLALTISSKINPALKTTQRIENLRRVTAVRLEELSEKLRHILRKLDNTMQFEVVISDSKSHTVYDKVLLKLAPQHFTDTPRNTLWASLNIRWSPSEIVPTGFSNIVWDMEVALVYAFCELGVTSSGTFECIPFFRRITYDHEKYTPPETKLLSIKPFLFFEMEAEDSLNQRFEGWLEETLVNAILELQRNI